MITILKAFVANNLFSVLLYGGIALAGVVGFSWWSLHQYNKGYGQAISDIDAENEGAVNAGTEARNKVRDCFNAGRTWDNGVCR